ncbi:MAG: hypothetical protein J5895_02700 [Alphaproteobacteria bacterium]|nr:hypothetical protein [Alphaproteobacteria bacterium]
MKDFLWNDNHYTTKYAGDSEEERKLYGVANGKEVSGLKIPQDEMPIRVFIYPFGGDNMGTTSHAALEYKDKTISYGSHGNGDRINASWESETCRVYEIYPSLIKDFTIDTEKLEQLINEQQRKLGKDYRFFTDNCADQCIEVLEKAGAKGIVQPAGVAVPQILEIWAKKYGHEVSANQVIPFSHKKFTDFLDNIQALRMHQDRQWKEKVTRIYHERSIKERIEDKIDDIKGKSVRTVVWYELGQKSDVELCARIVENFRKTRNDPERTQSMINKINSLQEDKVIDVSILLENGLNEEIKRSKLYMDKGEKILIAAPDLPTKDKTAQEKTTEVHTALGDAYFKMIKKHQQKWQEGRVEVSLHREANAIKERVGRLLRNQRSRPNIRGEKAGRDLS